MYKIYLFLIVSPCILFPKPFFKNYSETELHQLTSFDLDKLILPFDGLSHPIAQKNHIKKLINLFQQKRYKIFLNETFRFLKKYPNNIYHDELSWLVGHAFIEINDIDQAEKILIPLANHANKEIKYRTLIDLSHISMINKKYKQALSYLLMIYQYSEKNIYKEIAHTKLIHIYFVEKNINIALKLLKEFEKIYPDSKYLPELQYFLIMSELSLGEIEKAEYYAKNLLKISQNVDIQRIIAEIGLQKKDYNQTLEHYLPLTTFQNKHQDEALYKTALIEKMNNNFQNAYDKLLLLVKYFPKSQYHKRASEELANVNILLKKYDAALIFFLHESGYSGSRKASALLKITEINFLKNNTSMVRRTANRLQKEFPYSAYANEALYWVGRSYILEEKFAKSIEIFDHYLIREPQSNKKDEIMIFLGHAHANLNNITESRAYFHEIINTSSNDILKRNALIGLGSSYTKSEPARSLEFFDAVWKTWPNSAEAEQALYFSGATHYNLKQNKEALKNFKQLIVQFPDSSFYQESLLAIAKLKFKLENFTDLIEDNNHEFIGINKEISSELKELQARSFFRIGEYKKALALFQEASELTNNTNRQIELLLSEASTLRNMKKYKEAIQKYEKCLQDIEKSNELNSLKEILWSEIAFTYLEEKNIEKVVQIAEMIAIKFPKSSHLSNIYFKIADDYYLKKSYDKSSKYYRKIKNLSTQSDIITEAALREISSLDKSGDPQTQEKMEEFIILYPLNNRMPHIMERLSIIYSKQNTIEEEKIKNRIIAEFPLSPEAENARIYFLNKISFSDTNETFYKKINATKDSGLKAKYLYKLGLKLEKNQKFVDAVEVYKKIHKLKDINLGADALFNATKILNKQKKYEESLQLSINIIAQYDEKYYPKALDCIIQTYNMLDDKENAEKFKKRLIKQYPESIEAKKWSKILYIQK